MIEIRKLTKRRGDRRVVDVADLTVEGGRITAFLGPNGAGKSSTMRMIAGLDHPTSGTALVQGRPIAHWVRPAGVLGVMIDPPAIHPRWRVQDHLRVLAATHGIARRRVEQTLDECGLAPLRARPGRELSLGMRQRLGIAMAILADPSNLLLDEPMNGLDPDGMRWLRWLLTQQAERGGTVLLSSHQMKEVQELADDVAIILDGRVVTHRPLSSFVSSQASPPTIARSPEAERLERVLRDTGAQVTRVADTVTVWGITSDRVGELSCRSGLVLHELRTVPPALEQVYLDYVRAQRTVGSSMPQQLPSPRQPQRGPHPIAQPQRDRAQPALH